MAVAPLQISQLGAVSGGLDFSPLGQLGQVYQKGQESAKARELEQARKMTLADLGGNNDPNAWGQGAMRLAGLGDLQGATQLAAIQKSIAPETSPLMQSYKMAQAQGYKGTILEYEKEKAAAGAARTNVTTNVAAGEKEFEKELSKGQAKRWNDMIESGGAASKKLVDINTMREISQRAGSQGATADFKRAIGPYAEALGIKIDGLSDVQAYDQVIQRLAPQQRASGSGSTSDIEFEGFLRSLPALNQDPAAREVGLNTMEALTRDDIARGDIASRLATREITRVQAEKELRALPDPMAGFAEWRKKNPQLYSSAVSGRPATPSSVAPKAPPPANIDVQGSLNAARAAIQDNPSARDAIIKKLQANGIDASGL